MLVHKTRLKLYTIKTVRLPQKAHPRGPGRCGQPRVGNHNDRNKSNKEHQAKGYKSLFILFFKVGPLMSQRTSSQFTSIVPSRIFLLVFLFRFFHPSFLRVFDEPFIFREPALGLNFNGILSFFLSSLVLSRPMYLPLLLHTSSGHRRDQVRPSLPRPTFGEPRSKAFVCPR